MGLFSPEQEEQINAIAAKSKEVLKPIQVSKSVSATQHEIDESTKAVLEYFGDSPAILITTVEELHEYVLNAIKAGYCGIDTETTGKDVVHDTIVGCSLYYPGGVECYIPCKHIVPIFNTLYRNQLTYEQVGKELQLFVEAKTKMIFANAGFDLAVIYKDFKVDMISVFYYDVIHAWRCIKENEKKNGLKELYAKYPMGGKADPKKFSDFFSPKLFPFCKPDVAKLYAANDAKITYELFLWQLPYITKSHVKCQRHKLERIADLVWNIEMPMVRVCALMHRYGIYLDKDTSNVLKPRYHIKYDKEFSILSNMVEEIMATGDVITRNRCPFKRGADFNPSGSSPHTKYLLEKFLGIQVDATDKDALTKINLPITNQILKVRSFGVLINSFVDKLPSVTGADGRIHSTFNSIGASTGRFSSKDPNVQNIPSHALDIRHQFRATPAMELIDTCIQVDNHLEITIGSYDSVIINGGYQKDVVDLCIGDEIISITGVLKICDIKHNLPYTTLSFDSSEVVRIKHRTPAYVMMSSDYSQQEPKLTAFISSDKNMCDAFKNGKDIYATIASLAFNYPYEECMEFNPITGANQPEGKERRSQAKSIVLGICYGRTTKTIGEQLFGKNKQMTEEERTKAAQGVYDAVLNAFPNLRAAMEKAQADARRQGYVETILGRRRHIPDMQLKPYEFKAGKGYVNPDIDPLDPKTLKNKNDIPERIVRKLEKEFAGYKYKGQIYKRIKQLEEQEHIRVINNTRKIGDATRQCLNCVDSETEILTTSGWKHYNEISIGDTILSFDTEQGYITTDIIEDIIINQGTQSLICFDTPTFNALSTPEHRWVTQESGGRIKIKTTDDIYKHKWPDYPILRSADNQFEDNPKYSDNMLKLLGWIMTDGTIDYKLRHILLYQSTNKPKNLIVYSDMIATLQALGIEYTDRVTENYHSIYLKQCEFKDFVIENFPNRQLSYEFVSSISQRQARIILRAMLQGDGTGVDGNGDAITNKSVSICCGTAEKRDILQYLAFVAGYATNAKAIISSEKDYPSNHIQYASMGNIPVSNSTYYDITILRVKRAHIYPKHKSVVSCDLSWCVTTRNHTWVARRSGKVYITGNSEIQGSAAELTKIAMLKVFNNAEWKSLGGRVINQVHDELIAEIPIRNAERGGEILSRLMSEAGSFLPFTISCDVTTTLRWYGLSYPCEYSKPTSIEVPEQLTESEIAWIQYQLFELEYPLPIHKKEGVKLEGDKALGVDGEWSDAMDGFINDYMNRYHISRDEFLDHIEAKVIYDLQKLN